MKKTILIGALALLCAVTNSNAQQNPEEDAKGWLAQFLDNNPTNTFDFSFYGLYNTTTKAPRDVAAGWGGGVSAGYWMNPSIGMKLDANYCDESWTFANIGLAGRGTVSMGDGFAMTTYVTAGPGWNMTEVGKTYVVVAGAGAEFDFKKIPFLHRCKPFAEYRHVTSSPDAQDLLMFGAKVPLPF